VEVDPTVRLQTEGHVPEAYVADPTLRLNLYKRLGAVRSAAELGVFREELIDRFGAPPPEVDALLAAMDLKLQARRLKIEEVDARRDAVRVRFAPDPPVAAETIVALLKAERGRLRYVPDNVLEYRTAAPTAAARLDAARKLLQRLQTGVTVPT
jgi:transcription-repair coupling factor (superfamily II helicase)